VTQVDDFRRARMNIEAIGEQPKKVDDDYDKFVKKPM
jgi:hypothetical protein